MFIPCVSLPLLQESDAAFRVKPCAVSTIDNSHRSGITQLEWLPPTVEVVSKSRGRRAPDATETFQFMTTAGDGQILVWDTRYKEKAAKKATAAGAAVRGDGWMDGCIVGWVDGCVAAAPGGVCLRWCVVGCGACVGGGFLWSIVVVPGADLALAFLWCVCVRV